VGHKHPDTRLLNNNLTSHQVRRIQLTQICIPQAASHFLEAIALETISAFHPFTRSWTRNLGHGRSLGARVDSECQPDQRVVSSCLPTSQDSGLDGRSEGWPHVGRGATMLAQRDGLIDRRHAKGRGVHHPSRLWMGSCWIQHWSANLQRPNALKPRRLGVQLRDLLRAPTR
jgi:hypothetical protein